MDPIEIMKSGGEKIILEMKKYRGNDVIACRIWYLDDSGEWRPTKRGLNMAPKRWLEVLPIIQAMLDSCLVDTAKPAKKRASAAPKPGEFQRRL